MERNGLSNFGRESSKEHSYENIKKSVYRFSRSRLKLFFLFIALAAMLFNGAKRFERLLNFGSIVGLGKNL